MEHTGQYRMVHGPAQEATTTCLLKSSLQKLDEAVVTNHTGRVILCKKKLCSLR
jgi:hypothetical protein